MLVEKYEQYVQVISKHESEYCTVCAMENKKHYMKTHTRVRNLHNTRFKHSKTYNKKEVCIEPTGLEQSCTALGHTVLYDVCLFIYNVRMFQLTLQYNP